jgi:hypothetical protein
MQTVAARIRIKSRGWTFSSFGEKCEDVQEIFQSSSSQESNQKENLSVARIYKEQKCYWLRVCLHVLDKLDNH